MAKSVLFPHKKKLLPQYKSLLARSILFYDNHGIRITTYRHFHVIYRETRTIIKYTIYTSHFILSERRDRIIYHRYEAFQRRTLKKKKILRPRTRYTG